MFRSSQVQLSDPPLLPLVPFSVLFLLQVLDCYSLFFPILTKDEGRMSRGALQSVWSLILIDVLGELAVTFHFTVEGTRLAQLGDGQPAFCLVPNLQQSYPGTWSHPLHPRQCLHSSFLQGCSMVLPYWVAPRLEPR